MKIDNRSIYLFTAYFGKLLLLISFGLVGCSFFEEDEKISLGKCHKSSRHTNDSLLFAATQYKLSFLVEGTMNPALEAMLANQEINDQLYPHGTSTDLSFVDSKLKDWASSSYCRKIVKDFSIHATNQIESILSISRQTTSTRNEPTCKIFQEHVSLTYKLPNLNNTKDKLISTLHETLLSANKKLPEYKKEELGKLLGNSESMRQLALSTASNCANGKEDLSQALADTSIFKNLQSSRTKELTQLDRQTITSPECGDFPDAFCLSTLRQMATKLALERSLACDAIELETCVGDAASFIQSNLSELEKEKLNIERNKLLAYLENPATSGGNFSGNMRIFLEDCKQTAIQRGLKGPTYEAHVQNICLPEALARVTSPKRDALIKIEERLKILE